MEFYYFILFTFLILITIGYVDSSKKKIIYFIISFSLLFLSMFRYNVGFDYMNYFSSLNLIIKNGINSNFLFYNRIEPAYKFLVIISFHLKSVYFLFFISSFITITLVSFSIYRYSKDYLLSIFIFFCFPFFYLDSFSIIRQWTALSIIIFGYSMYFKNKKIFNFLFFITLATLFHSTAIFVVFILPLIFFNLNKKRIFILFLIGLILKYHFINLIPYFNTSYLSKIDRLIITKGGEKLQYFIYIIAFIFFIFKNKLDTYSNDFKIHINTFFIATFFIFLFSDFGQIAQRVSIYFYFTIIFIIPDLIYYIYPKYSSIVKFHFYLFFAFIFIFSLYISFSRNNYSPLIPYKFIFNA